MIADAGCLSNPAHLTGEDLPVEMRIRLREYFQQTVHVRFTQKRAELLESMSPSLKSEVAWQCNKEWLSKVWFLRGSSQSFLVQLSLKLTAQVFAPGENAPAGRLYIVHRGVALYGGKVYGSGRVWGEDMILTSDHLQKKYSARAMIFLSVFSLSREDLEEVAGHFPMELRRIRRAAITLATRRAFVEEAYARANRLLGFNSSDNGDGVGDGNDGSSYANGREDSTTDTVDSWRGGGSVLTLESPPSRKPSVCFAPAASANGYSRKPARRADEQPGVLQLLSQGDSCSFFSDRSQPTGARSMTPAEGGGQERSVNRGLDLDALRPMIEAMLANSKKLAEQMEAHENGQQAIENTIGRHMATLSAMSTEVQDLRRQIAGNTLNDVLAKLRP